MTISERTGRTGFKFGFSYFLFFAIYGISSPYLQIMLRRIGYSPASVGILLGIFELVGILGPIVLARKADAMGRFNPFLVGSSVIIVMGSFLLVTVKSPLGTILSLSLLSLGLKTPVPVMDTSILIALERERAMGRKTTTYGTLRGLGSVGFVLVTLSLQIIPGFEAQTPAVMAIVMASLAVVFLISLYWLPESGSGQKTEKKAGLNLAWIDSTFLIGLGVIALGRLAMASLNSFFSLYLMESLQWHAIGAMSALAAIVEIPMMILSWKFMRKKSPMQVISLASAAIVVRLLIYAIFPSRLGVIAGQLLHSICYGLFQPASIVFVNLKTPPGERTTGMALLLGIGMGLPAFIGSALGGLVVEAVGYRWLFAIFSLFAVLSLVLYRMHKKALIEVR